jgi:hypothetical protein
VGCGLNVGILPLCSEGKDSDGPLPSPPVPPTFAAAVGQGLRAAVREAWLVPVGAVLGVARRAALWPAFAVLAAVVLRAAVSSLVPATPLDPAAPLRGALGGALLALASPRLHALLAGLALSGALLGAAVRVAWLSGALPTLGLALSGAPRAPRFASGVAYGLPRVLAAASLGLVAELGAAAFAGTLALAALRVATRLPRAGAAPAIAAACALVLVIAAAAPIVAGAAADAAVARAALRGEGAARAFAGAVRRLVARPGSFVLAALGFTVAAFVAPLSLEGVGSAVLGFAGDAPAALLAGPHLMLRALAALVAAALDVWWLATVAALACGGDGD